MSEANSTTEPPKAYGEWVTMYITNSGSKDIKLQGLSLDWGKMYADGDKDKELPTSQFNGHVIHPGEQLQMNSCGREYASSGTEGHYDLVDCTDNDKIIRHFYWECPWGSPRNTFTVSASNENWVVEQKGGIYDSGALGTIFIECINKS